MVSPLTTVAQPFFTMGNEGCLKLIDSIHNETEIKSEVVAHELIVRQSVKTLS